MFTILNFRTSSLPIFRAAGLNLDNISCTMIFFMSAAECRSVDLRPEAKMYGAVAQLGERLNGIQEADGSIPFSSTIKNNELGT